MREVVSAYFAVSHGGRIATSHFASHTVLRYPRRFGFWNAATCVNLYS